MTVVGYRTNQPPQSWDVANDPFTTDYWTTPYAEYLLAGDIEGKGPRGTNEFPFQVQESIPVPYLTGELAASWEQPDPLTLIFHIRQGVMWTGNATIGMAAREFTATDAAFEMNRYWKGPYGGANVAYFDSATATDKYTFVVKMKTFSPDWSYRIGYAYKCSMYPPETVTAGAGNWKNQCGTGPFILSDYVEGSGVTYKKNLNYWGKTTINGKQYQTPFVDTLIYPIITDPSTQISAIRTGKIDIAWGVPMTNKTTLASSSPDLKTFSFLKNSIKCVGFLTTNPKFSNVAVRRAMMIGTDLKKIANAVYPGGAEINDFPLSPGLGDVYTPIDKMPASTQALFNYDPVTAKKMLADAGYPNGFSCELVIQADPEYNDIAALLVDQWAKIGVTVTIKSLPVASWSGIMANHNYTDVFMSATGNGSITTHLPIKVTQGVPNTANWNDPHAVELLNKALATSDITAQTALFKELNLYILDQCAWIGFASPYQLSTYWPWVKNYYGEVEGGDYNYIPIIRLMWLDTAQKKAMGH